LYPEPWFKRGLFDLMAGKQFVTVAGLPLPWSNLPGKRIGEPVKYCPTCLKSGTKTIVERHGDTPLNYCTFHYWLMRGKVGGHYSLEAYVEASELHQFKTSLPSPENMARMGEN
jgi:hypothetical protein